MDVKERKINVFVSSTFRDMQAERDELVKRIFPQLRKLCEERGVTWGEVDLRWGITDEQKAEGKVLPICLAEIEHCRPYFIGMLGERYGWIDDEIPQAVIEQYEWLNEYKGKSVTELEILHGVLRDPEMADHAFFYLRDPMYLNSIAENERINYIEAPIVEDIQIFGLEEAERRAEEKKNKLVKLKKAIKNSVFPVREYYANPEALGELVLQDLKDVVNSLYPESQKHDLLEQARFEHENFAESRFNVYIERKEYFDRLDAHVKDNGLPLVVVGESGSGKSALIANWAKKYKENDADKPFLLVHHIGATPDSMDWVYMLRRIMGEMKLHFDIQQDIPDKPDELKAAFANWLHMTATKGKMVLIIDALNQLEDRDGALELYWLPVTIPPNIKLIVSSLPGRSLDELNNRDWPILEVKSLDLQERKKLIVDYLKQYSRSLSDLTVEHIISNDRTSNPLYLRALLEEMRLYGDHSTLLQKIDHYLAAHTVDELYDKILERYEQDYDRDRKNLVRDTFSCLWASRKGLSQIELLEMLGSNGEPLPGAFWSPLYLSAEKSLVNRSGLLSFSHDYLRTAVKKRYLETEGEEGFYHSLLAGYFEKRELSKRQVEELPWQLSSAKSWNKLADLLTDPSFFIAAWDSNQFDVKGYWVLIEDNSELSTVLAYKPIIDSLSKYNDQFSFRISILLNDTGHLLEAFSLYNKLTEYYLKTDNVNSLQASLGNQAIILYFRGDPEGATKLYKEQERICRELGNKIDLAISLGNQALILYSRGDLDEAMKLYKEQERLCREISNKDNLQTCLGNQALIHYSRGDLDEAMKLHKEKEKVCRELGNKEGLQTSLGNQALICYSRGDLEGAMKLYKEQERICKELGNKDSLQKSLGNQALILFDRGNLDEAMKLFKEQERICRELGNKESLQASLGNQAIILYFRGDLESAMKLRKEEERICKKLGSKEGLQGSLGGQALILYSRGDLEGAMKLHKEEERICKELGNKDGLQKSLGNQALILDSRGDLDEAMKLNKEKEKICRELGNKEDLQISLGNQANIFYTRGDLGEAMKLHKEEERICRELGNKEGLQKSLGNQANILYSRGDLGEAMKLYKEKERICRELGNKDSLQVALGNQALILYSRGDLEGAMKLYKEQERICKKLGSKEGLQGSLGGQANILYSTGDLDEALKLHKEEERICRELENKDGLQASLGNQANILYSTGDLEGAMKLYKEQERICKELGNKEGLQGALGNQANILYSTGDPERAMKLYKEQEEMCRELGSKDSLQESLGNQAVIFHSRGDLDEAMKLHREKERICRELGNKKSLAISLGNQALILYSVGDLEGAMKLYKEQEEMCRELGNKENLATSLINQALCLTVSDQYQAGLQIAEEAYKIASDYGYMGLAKQIEVILQEIQNKEEERICRELGNKEGLQVSLGNQASILYSRGDLEGAMKLFKEQEEICIELENRENLAISLINQALCLTASDQPHDGLKIAEKAFKIAIDYEYNELAEQIKAIIQDIRKEAK